MTRGGRRPGAGAPKGNVNGLRHGRYSRRYYLGALMIAVVPELRLIFRALAAEYDRKQRQRYVETMAEAYRATLEDPALANSIRQLVVQDVRTKLAQIRQRQRGAEKTQNPIKQSNLA
ncbi:MAG TPA: hypothetical protein VI759_03530 [Dehalococcoidia bacterium]|nr:hypothetical protein [Dehalococcoidia bacterium]